MTTLSELAQLVGGNLRGEADLPILGAAVLAEAESGQITFIDQAERVGQLATTKASAAIVPRDAEAGQLATIAVDDVHKAFAQVFTKFHPRRPTSHPGISPAALVSASAMIGANVDIHPQAVIGDGTTIGDGATIGAGAHLMAGCRIGRDVSIGSRAVLYENTIVGDRSAIHAGVVIGAPGFGYTQVDGRHVLAAQLGHVEIGADVDIGANTTIDRGTYGATVIGDGTKIDNLVQIAHNCRIGRGNLICSQVGIAGSTTTGDYVVMAGQVGIRDHVHIGAGAVLSAKAGVSNDVPAGAVMLGIPATPIREQKLKLAALAKLPEMRKEFKAIRRTIQRIVEADEHDDSSAAA